MLKAKNRHGVYWRLDCYLLCCALVTKVFVKQILMVDHILEYTGHSISNQPTLFPIKIGRFLFSKIQSLSRYFSILFLKNIFSNDLTKI